ncbi:MAG: sigma-E processing peptidase SpoIIGA [Oscillospiraceae bacterium]|nr:sigma-E processing peptidase SpoIIGA [Oscillospiraceae bacterium]
MEVIYADSLFLLNAVIDYLLLLAAAKVSAAPLRRWRLALGAALGGAYSVAAALWPQYFALGAVKAAAAAVMVLAAFGAERFWRRFLTFLAAAALFAGAVYALSGLAGGRVVNVSMGALALAFAVCYAAVSLVFRHSGERAERCVEPLKLELAGRRVTLAALLDSGNGLRDAVSGLRAAVGDAKALAELFPPEARELLGGDPAAVFERLCALPELRGRLRLLPYSAVGVAGGLLLCFTPDSAELGGRRVRLAVAVSPTPLSPDGEFSAVY